MIIPNIFVYIGLGLFALGFLLFIVSIIMERHYEVTQWELKERKKWKA